MTFCLSVFCCCVAFSSTQAVVNPNEKEERAAVRQMEIAKTEGEAVLLLEEDYVQPFGTWLILQTGDGHLLIDGQGHTISAMFLGEGNFTLRNCRIRPMLMQDWRSADLAGLSIEGSTKVALESTVVLETLGDRYPSPVQIAMDWARHATDLQLQNDAQLLGDGVGVTCLRLIETTETLTVSGTQTGGYAFSWPNLWNGGEAGIEETDVMPYLKTEKGKVRFGSMRKVELLPRGELEAQIKYLLPFTVETVP